MKILTRYILKKFTPPFLFIFGLLYVLILVSKILDRLDKFMNDGVVFKHVLGYLVTSMSIDTVMIMPVAAFMAVLYVVGHLARSKEYVAGLAGGIPPEKFLGGLLFAGLFISLFTFVLNETVVPPMARFSATVLREKIKRLGRWRQSVYTDLFVSGADGRLWSIKMFNFATAEMKRVMVDTYENGRLESQIDALTAKYDQQVWTFRDGVIREFSTNGLAISQVTKFTEKNFSFAERPNDLVIQEPQAEQMNIHTLRDQIKRLSALGVPVRKLEVDLMRKIAFPISCFVVVFLGIPVALKGKGNIGKGIAVALMLTMAYIGLVDFGRAMAQRFIPPFLGAWLGNIIFLSIGSYLWMKMRRTA